MKRVRQVIVNEGYLRITAVRLNGEKLAFPCQHYRLVASSGRFTVISKQGRVVLPLDVWVNVERTDPH